MQTKLISELNKVLKAFPQFWNGEELHRTIVVDAISRKQPDLIKALVANEKIKSVYGTDIDGIFIFDFDNLCKLLKYKEYWSNSFTKYRNKVGLTSEGKYLDYSSDVVLDFPFKDCVLEGGMTKEDQGKDEIYYNEIIARDEIDRLFSPKVFMNAKRFKKDNVEENVKDFNNEDSLILKGNNLIALHSLKKRYAGQVNLIYIDPPYNTDKDSFKYNDRFNRSSWLTFMKNRLEVARDLLSDEGSILIQIDWHESHYLKILLDSIFKESNFINEIIWHYSSGGDFKNSFAKKHDVIFWYSKNLNYVFYPENNLVGERRGTIKKNNMKKNIDDNGKTYYSIMSAGKEYRYHEDDIVVPDDVWNISILQQKDPERTGFNSQKPEKLIARIIGACSTENDLVLDFHLGSGTTAAVAHKMGRRYIGIEQMDYINDITVPRLQKVIAGEQSGISKDVNWQGGGSFVYAELMELNAYFVHEIQKAQSNEELEKLFAVMKTEAHLNYQVALENVLSAEYEVDGIFRKVAFSELELHEQKRLLIEILDKNQLYVNASEMDDCDLNISESDKAFTRSFYGME